MANEKTMINDLTEGNVASQLLKFAAPFMLAQLLQTVYSMVDMVIVGQFVGSSGLSGVTIGSEILMLFSFVGIGFSSAGQIMISQFIGRGERDSLKSMIGTMFSFILMVSLILTVICVPLRNTFLRWMNTPEEAFDYASGYALVCYLGLFFIFGYNIVSAILRGMGDSKRPLLFIAIAAVLNLLLDLLFVAVLHMAAVGAALATVMGQGLSFMISLVYLYRRRDAFGFDFKPSSFRIDKTKLKPLVKLGLPMFLQSAAISLSMLFVNAYINAYGVVASAATGVGNKMGNVISIMTMSVMTAGSAMMGQNFGAGKYDRIKKIVHVSHLFTIVFAAFFVIIFLLFPYQIFGIFDPNPEVQAWAPTYMKIAAINYMAFAFMAPYNALINGLGFATLSFIIGIMDGVVARIGLSLLFGLALNMGIAGFWLGNALAGYMTVLLGGIYYFSGKWKTRKLIIET